MPTLEKTLIDNCLNKINKKYQDFPVFIESGTFMGETTLLASTLFTNVYSIELDIDLYNRATSLFKNTNNISILFGDTIKILPNILSKEFTNSIFWIDGHHSGFGTAEGEISFPALQECEIIDQNFKGDEGLILIDDVRLFGIKDYVGTDDSLLTLTIDKILNAFKEKSIINYWLEPSSLAKDDRLIIYVKNKKNERI